MVKIIPVIILLLLVLSGSAIGQADMDHRRFENAITDLAEAGRDVYELGFNDGIQCMILIQLKYKYGDEAEQPTLNDMADMCRVKWSVEDRE